MNVFASSGDAGEVAKRNVGTAEVNVQKVEQQLEKEIQAIKPKHVTVNQVWFGYNNVKRENTPSNKMM